MHTDHVWYELWTENGVYYTLSEPHRQHLLGVFRVAAECKKQQVAIAMGGWSPYFYFFERVFGSQSSWHLNEILTAALGVGLDRYSIMWRWGNCSHLVLIDLTMEVEDTRKSRDNFSLNWGPSACS